MNALFSPAHSANARCLRPAVRCIAAALALMGAPALADDGAMFRRNVSSTPSLESEFADVKMMRFYVPAQNSAGALLKSLVYTRADGTLYFTRSQAKPLIAVYNDGHVDAVDDLAFVGFGQRDAYAAVSLDDGATWQRVNLSRSGTTEIDFNVAPSAAASLAVLPTGRDGLDDDADDDKVAKDKDEKDKDEKDDKDRDDKDKEDHGSGGLQPRTYYGDVIAVSSGVAGNKVLVAWLSKECSGGNPAYLLADGSATMPWSGEPYADLFAVQGSQGYVDYAEQDLPQIGVVPFSCVWTARGTLVQDAAGGTTKVIWRSPERLTSGRRDANRIEVGMAEGGGFAVTWQEDPQGTLPGQGEGPGEGWAGAVVNHQTDIWYSYIPWDYFDQTDANGDGMADTLAGQLAATRKPPVLHRMSIPVRITDNARCFPGSTLPFCEGLDANGNATPDFCAATVSYADSKGNLKSACRTEDGRVLHGQTGASRARLNLQAYTRADGSQSAWAMVVYEESKGLGEVDLDGDGKGDELGKDIRYQSFELTRPDLVKQGLQLNAPSRDWACITGQPDPRLVYTDECYIDWNASMKQAGLSLIVDAPLYDSEIARRGALMSQSVAAVEASQYGTGLVTIFKQGVINQGGPADVMIRRFVAPTGFDAATDNPYAAANMACGNWAFTDGANPNYLEGLCLTPATNVSGTTPLACADGSLGENCGYKAVDPADQTVFPKVYTWQQTEDNLADESWFNPYDVAKGHRGILSGDFVMAQYAWSPNWKLNDRGQDVYNLYIRRSFDGGQTWTNTPVALGGAGTNACEVYRSDSGLVVPGSIADCPFHAPGTFEPARNVSMMTTLKTTVLDPRYTPTGGLLKHASTAFKLSVDQIVAQPAYYDDTRDPSKYFLVYETGDNATVQLGAEAHPLDMFYSRATVWGDRYSGFSSDSRGNPIPWVRFDALENKDGVYAAEAALTANPLGTMLYALWNHWEEKKDGTVFNSDAVFRRVLFADPVPVTSAGASR